jgi:hypothetical protein
MKIVIPGGTAGDGRQCVSPTCARAAGVGLDR